MVNESIRPPDTNGNARQAIANLQRYLRQLALNRPDCTLPPQDGIWESQTERALREFQQSAGLPPSGRADPETWEALYAAYLQSLSETAPAARLPLFPEVPPGAVLEIGAISFAVQAVQFMLDALSLQYGAPPLAINGVYDDATAGAVATFQNANALPVTGHVDRATWNRLVEHYASLSTSDEG